MRSVIYFLRSADEVSEEYDVALKTVCKTVVWFSSYDFLLNSSDREQPIAVVVDLETLGSPIEVPLEQLRAAFPRSELFAISAVNSAQLALQCIRAGFSDFLLKPASPEELAWRVRQVLQRHQLLEKLLPRDSKSALVRAITQISTCTTPALVQLYTLEYLKIFLGSQGGAWVAFEGSNASLTKVMCTVPRSLSSSDVILKLPFDQISLQEKKTQVLKGPSQSLLLPAANFPDGALFFWNIKRRLTPKLVEMAQTLVEHGDMNLLNLQRFEDIKKQTLIDDLTGLYNARYLKFAITNGIIKCKEANQEFSVLFIDVDHFKSINDTHGHLIGSEFLVAIAKTVRNAVRGGDTVLRYGGDEFVVILNDTGVAGAREIAERIRKNIERRVFIIKGQRIQSTVSIGLASYPEHAKERETLLRLADEAMYSVKKTSRNAVHLAIDVVDKAS